MLTYGGPEILFDLAVFAMKAWVVAAVALIILCACGKKD